MSIDLVKRYLDDYHFRIVTWPANGDTKGPTGADAKGWTKRQYGLDDYHPGDRVGILTGTEIERGKWLHDVDIDFAAGAKIALELLPPTAFVFGRESKRISHCFYTTAEALPSFKYEDIDKTTLIELRGTMTNGDIGLQTMAPPSVWSKEGKTEVLSFIRSEGPSHIDVPAFLKQRVCLAAIGMMLARHLGTNGFGHDVRLCWAGFLLRAVVPTEDVIKMGEAISIYCNNNERSDVRRVVESTAAALTVDSKKVKGGPALAKILGENGKKIVAKINEWLGRDSDFLRKKDGAIVADNQDNIKRAVGMLGVELSYNTFAERPLIKEGAEWNRVSDKHVNSLWLRIDREYHFRPTFAFFQKVIDDLTHETSFHPVRDYFHTLKWDGVSRIDNWLVTYGSAVDPHEGSDSNEERTYLQAISSIVLIAAVRRIRQPGCKYDEMLVLESEQGFNKSSALRALCPNDDWFSDDLPLNVDAKQIIERTLGKWIIEASDLVGGRKADRDHLKSMLSRQIDGPARMAYDRNASERARQFVIVGTTNGESYLQDSTGARRFWPVRVGRFDVPALVRDRDQLWAEACYRESQDESIRLPERLWGAAGEEQELRREVDAWEDVIEAFVTKHVSKNSGRIVIIADDIWKELGITLDRRDRYGAQRISGVMQRLGFSRKPVRDSENKVVRGYTRSDVKPGEVVRVVGGEAPDEKIPF